MDIVKSLNNVIILFVFLFCGSVYPIIFGANIFYFLLFLLSSTSLFLQKTYDIQLLKSFVRSNVILMFFLLVNWILSGFNVAFIEFPVMFAMILIFNTAYLALENKEKLSIKSFDFVFVCIVIYSILNYIAASILKDFFVPFSNESYACKNLFFIFFYSAEHTIGALSLIRNQGFYWEPGVLSVVLNIFLFRLFFGDKISFQKGYIFLTVFLIITTFSTTGFLLVFIQFLYYLKQQNNKIKNFFILLFFMVLAIPLLLSNVNEKVSGSGEASFILRNYDALVALDVTKNNFLTGVGFSKIKNQEAQELSKVFMMSDFIEARGNTNSVITIFLYLGVPLGLLYLFVFYNQTLVDFKRGFFFFILLICLASEPLVFSGFFIFFLFSYFYKLKIVN